MNEFDINQLRSIYDTFADGYDQGRDGFDHSEQLDCLLKGLPEQADILDAGCGSGYPVLRFFADHWCRVTGMDICLCKKVVQMGGLFC